MISQINKVKQIFVSTLGNPNERAQSFRNKLIDANASVVFTQESDAIVPQLLTEDGIFHSIAGQNASDLPRLLKNSINSLNCLKIKIFNL
ncbi:MAG: hypothetical protein H0X29_02695 [Parachlamydiaceae bacterium]|nr:hypothetical protein [Parachlamydiaceae bacterium]